MLRQMLDDAQTDLDDAKTDLDDAHTDAGRRPDRR